MTDWTANLRAVLRGAGGIAPPRAVIPAALTPFEPDFAIAWSEFRRHLVALADVPGVTAVMVNGAAGQDAALTRDERRALVGEAVTTVGDRLPVLAALRETAEVSLADLARDATAEGADAVLLMPPPRRDDAALEPALRRYAEVLDATDRPVAVYQVSYATETLVALAASPRLVAVKEGSGDPATFERNLRALRAGARPVAVWSTHSRWLLADLALGADGLLSGLGSVAADLQVALAEAVWRSDLPAAREVSARLFPLTQVCYRPGHDAHARMKYALRRLGRWRSEVVRPPQQPLDETERALIDRALVASGLLAASDEAPGGHP